MSTVTKECQFECGEVVYHRADVNRVLQLFIVQRQVHDFASAMSVSYLCRLCFFGKKGEQDFATDDPWRHEYWEHELTR